MVDEPAALDLTDLDALVGARLMLPRTDEQQAVVGFDPVDIVDRRCPSEAPLEPGGKGCGVAHVERAYTLLLACNLCLELHISIVRFAHLPDGAKWGCPHCGTPGGYTCRGSARRVLERFAKAVGGAA